MIFTLVRKYSFDDGSNIKTIKTKENGRYVLDELHACLSLLILISCTNDMIR